MRNSEGRQIKNTAGFIRLVCLLLFLTFFCAPAFCLETKPALIQVYLRDGLVIESSGRPAGPPSAAGLSSTVSENIKLKSLNIGMIGAVMNGRVVQINWDDVMKEAVEIELMNPGLSPYKKGPIRIRKINGETSILTDATLFKYVGHDTPVKEFVIYSYDGFNKSWREENLDVAKVKKISIVSNIITPAAPIAHKSQSKKAKSNSKGAVVTIKFEPEIDEVAPEYHKKLKALADAFKKDKGKSRKIYVTGHTDFDKDKERSMEISKIRAEAVKDYLVKKAGVPESKIKVSYLGDKKPVATNKTPDGRSKNRRVEVYIK